MKERTQTGYPSIDKPWLKYYSEKDINTPLPDGTIYELICEKNQDNLDRMEDWDGWLRRRLRMYIWKQWKKPSARAKNLEKLGMPEWMAYRNGNTRKGYWAVAGSGILTRTITNERLAQAGYYSLSDRYESLHLCD